MGDGDPAVRLRSRWDAVRCAVEGELAGFCARATAGLVAVEPRAADLAEAVTSLTLAPAKRVRPLLLHYGHLLAGAGELTPEAVRLGAAVEMLHTFALLQDDVIDGSELRRGVPSTFARLGTAGAILASDVALTWADELLDDVSLPASTMATVRRQVRILRLETVAGEYLDSLLPPQGPERRRCNILKTARYTATRPLLVGAALGDHPLDVVALQDFGDALGVIFQLRDDELDVEVAPGDDDPATEQGLAKAALDHLDVPAGLTDELRSLLCWAAERSA